MAGFYCSVTQFQTTGIVAPNFNQIFRDATSGAMRSASNCPTIRNNDAAAAVSVGLSPWAAGEGARAPNAESASAAESITPISGRDASASCSRRSLTAFPLNKPAPPE